MATGTQVPWTTPGGTPCCCEEPCSSGAISSYYSTFPFGEPPDWQRVDIAQEQAQALRAGAALDFVFQIAFSGRNNFDTADFTSSGLIAGTITLGNNTAHGNQTECQAISESNFVRFDYYLDGNLSGQTLGFLYLQFFLQQNNGGWPGTDSTTTNESPAIFFAGSGRTTWGFNASGEFWGWQYYFGKAGTAAGNILGQSVYAVLEQGLDISAPIVTFDLTVTFAAP